MAIMQSKEIENALLKQVEDGIEAKLEGKAKGQYQAILLSGLQIMFSPKTRHLLEQRMQQDGDIVTKIAKGISQLVATIYQQSDGKMDIPEAVPAGIVLAMHALDFAQKSGMVEEITNDLIDQVTEATAKAILEIFGIDQEKVRQIVAQKNDEATGEMMPDNMQAQSAQNAQMGNGGRMGGLMMSGG